MIRGSSAIVRRSRLRTSSRRKSSSISPDKSTTALASSSSPHVMTLATLSHHDGGAEGGGKGGKGHSSFDSAKWAFQAIASAAGILAALHAKQEEGGTADCLYTGGKRQVQDYYKFVEKPIGTGGFGVVYVAQHRETGETVAIKQLPRTMASLPNLQLEVEIMRAAGEHRNIIGCKDAFQDEKYYYIVMEMAEGGELFDRLVEHGAYSEHQASLTMKAILDAVVYLHHQGIVHGDLKPENLLLATKAKDCTNIRIVDFGSSFRSDNNNPVIRKDKGTVAYRSPEMAKGEPCNYKSDMWSLGLVLHILLSGYHPFDPKNECNDEEIGRRIMQEPDKWVTFDDAAWKKISAAPKDLITKLLFSDPNQRPSAEEILRHPWIAQHAKLSDVPLQASADNLRRLHRGRRRLKAMMLTIMSGLATDPSQPSSSKNVDNLVAAESLGSRKAAIKFLDPDKKGYITEKDLSRTLRILGERFTKAEIIEMLNSAEGDPLAEVNTITHGQLTKLLPALCPAKVLKQKEVLYTNGEIDSHFYLVQKGDILKRLPNGRNKEVLVDVIKPGETFGEVEMLISPDGSSLPRLTSCECLTPQCELIAVEDYLFSLLTEVFESTDIKLRDQAERHSKKIFETWVKELMPVPTKRSMKAGEVVWCAPKHDPRKFLLVKEGFLEVHVWEKGEATQGKDGEILPAKTSIKQYGPESLLSILIDTEGDHKIHEIKCITDVNLVEIPGKTYEDFLAKKERKAMMKFLMEMQELKGSVIDGNTKNNRWGWRFWSGWGRRADTPGPYRRRKTTLRESS